MTTTEPAAEARPGWVATALDAIGDVRLAKLATMAEAAAVAQDGERLLQAASALVDALPQDGVEGRSDA